MKTPGKRTNKTQTDDTKNSKKKQKKNMTNLKTKQKIKTKKQLAGLSQTKPHAHILLEPFVF